MQEEEIEAVIYVRTPAKDPGEQEKSIQEQIRLCQEHAQKLGWEIVGIYIDRGFEGRGGPEMARLFQEAEEGRFEAVVAWKPDRFSSRLEELLAFLERLEKAGVVYEFVNPALP